MNRSDDGPAHADQADAGSTPEAGKLAFVDNAMRVLFERAGVGMAMVDPHGRFVRVNPKYCEITGYPENELLGMLVCDLTHPDDRPADRARMTRARDGETPACSVEKRYVRKDGAVIWVNVDGTVIHDATGRPVGGTAIIRDVTAEKAARAALEETERAAAAEKSALLEIARDITGTLDLGEILDRVQRRTAELLPCDVVVTFYWDAARHGFRLVSEYGGTPEQVAEVSALTFVPGAVFGGRLSGGDTVVVNDTTTLTGAHSELLARFGFNAFVAAPLLVRGRVLGTFFAFGAGNRTFSTSQVQLVESIARQLAAAIEAADLYEEQRRETHVANSLARLGRELISALDTPVLLDRLCQLTTELLDCDASYTLLRQPEDGHYVPLAGHGHSADEWEAVRVLRLPPAALAALVEALERHELVEVDTTDVTAQWAALPADFGATRALYIPLRHADEIAGIQMAAFRGRREPFDKHQLRIAGGIGRLASVALANARLVEKLEQANRIKLDFVNTMSHELRTPLHIILGYNDLLLQDSFGALTDEQRDGIKRVKQNAEELAALIDTTLDLRRLEARRIPLNLNDVKMTDLLEDLDAETRSLWTNGPVPVVFENTAGPSLLRTDRAKLLAVLKHLVANAVKFTEAGRVTVRIAPAGNGIEFAVADTGIGIPPELHSAIFEPFSQVDTSLTRRHRGVGLGLYVVRRLLDLLGGRIEVESAPGIGSTFRAWIPSAAPDTTLPDRT